MTLKELIQVNNWLSVELILLKLYPDQEKLINQYQKIYEELLKMDSESSDMKIVLNQYDSFDEENKEYDSYVDVSGTKVINEDPICNSYALEFVEWNKWLGMEIVEETIATFSELEIIAHCLYEMTFVSFDEEEIQEEIKSLNKQMEEFKGLSEEEKKVKTYSLDELLNSLNKKDKS